MAEVIGTIASALTIASLFKVCVEAFDVVQAVQNQPSDLKKIALKLNIEKCRLYIWGQAMGLTSITEPRQQTSLDSCPYPELISETLELILDLFRDSHKLGSKYGCAMVESASSVANYGPRSTVTRQLNASFDNFKIMPKASAKRTPLAKKTSWAIRDRKKFGILIDEAKALIDGLQDITKDLRSQELQDEMMTSRIQSISDVRTLDWVSEVCEIDYPALSDAASLKAETISETSSFHREIENWKDTITIGDESDDSDDSSVQSTIAALEDMTVTEVKHKFSSYLLRARETRLNKKIPESKTEHSISAETERETQAPMNDSMQPQFTVEDLPLSEAELRINESLLSNMAEAAQDKDFEAEQIAINEWFKVLSPAEQLVSFYRLGEHFSTNLEKTRLFARIQNYRLTKMDPSAELKFTDEVFTTNDQVSSSSLKTKETAAQPSAPATAEKKSQDRDSLIEDPNFIANVSDSFGRFAQLQKETIATRLILRQDQEKVQKLQDLKAFSLQLGQKPFFRK